MKDFGEYVGKSGEPLVKDEISCLQMNLGYACNLNCSHCHVEAGPHRQEKMSLQIIDDCIRFAEEAGVKTVDLTGGAPELNPHLRHLITGLRKLPTVDNIILRSNLAILDEPEYADLPEFLLKNDVTIIASMPCYLEENVDTQRGNGVYDKNIRVLQRLNGMGYGGQNGKLHLVYNPGGDFLPGPQPMLEGAYKEELQKRFGITFNSLYTITNMAIGRFSRDLEKSGRLEAYQDLLADSFNADNLDKVMCRTLISVDWQGRIYDCDFNHVLQMPVELPKNHIGSVQVNDLLGRPILLGEHCFACTAGAGSSCQGSLSDTEHAREECCGNGDGNFQSDDSSLKCAKCPTTISSRNCFKGISAAPAFCPTLNKQDLIKQSCEEYHKSDIYEFAHQAGLQEEEGWSNRDAGYGLYRPSKTRLEEIIEFAGKMKYQRLGLAFCLCMAKEAAALEKLLTSRGFKVESAVCKVGKIPKTEIGIDGSDESICNPVLQAMVMNDAGTDFNIMLGLCVGHDSLFLKYAEAPCTVFAVKDRVLGNNPLAALNYIDTFYRSINQSKDFCCGG